MLGESNVGKSSFLQSNPNCFLINVEGMPVTNPTLKSWIWPFRDSNALPCEQCEEGDEGAYTDAVLAKQGIQWVRPIFLTWEAVMAKVDLIIQMRKEGVPGAPSMVALDTVSGALKLLEDWVVRNSVPLGISQEVKENFAQLHGPSAYDEMYGELLNIGVRCRNAGLGFMWVIHLTYKEIRDAKSGQRVGKELGYNMTSNLWSRLFSWWECVAALAVRTRSDFVQLPPKKVADGKGGFKEVPQGKSQVTRKERYLVLDAPPGEGLSDMVKRKVKMDSEVVLSNEESAWDDFKAAYIKEAKIV